MLAPHDATKALTNNASTITIPNTTTTWNNRHVTSRRPRLSSTSSLRCRPRRILRLLAPVVLLFAVLTPQAEAGWGYWSASPCRWWDIEWYRTSYGVAYWQHGYSEHTGAHWVTEAHGFRDAYERLGWECGSLGAVRSNPYFANGLWRLDFERGQLTSTY